MTEISGVARCWKRDEPSGASDGGNDELIEVVEDRSGEELAEWSGVGAKRPWCSPAAGRERPCTVVSLREGLPETLMLMRLGIDGQLSKTLCSTNPCESMIEIVRYTQCNVERWQDGDTRKRWTAAGILVAEQQFRRIIGYRDLAKLVIAIERHTILTAHINRDRQEIAEPVAV